MTSCILTIIKNEHEYLDEWIKYHLDLGVDHIFIFEDIDSDSHKSITDKYSQVTLNSVRVLLNEDDLKNVLNMKQYRSSNPQFTYIKRGLTHIKNSHFEYNWCFVIDCDEFITLEKENLNNALSLYKDYDAIILQWECYGANGLVDKPNYSEKGVVETYTEKIKGIIPTKSRTSYTKTCFNLNNYIPEFFWYTHQPSNLCNFCNTKFRKDRVTPVYDNIYIRHYITKSWEEYVWKKINRGYLYGRIRSYDFFFKVNPDMIYRRDELIRLVPILNPESKILVVLPYLQKGSQGKELQLALSGWRRFCTFDYHFVVIGEFDSRLKDEFPWVEFIECKQKELIPDQYNQHLDVQHGMEIVMNKFIDKFDGFIWMVDDNYAIKTFTATDITTTHYHSPSFIGNENQPTSFWNHDKWKTRQLLDRENLPHINYTTHYPCWFEFSKLKLIWDKFDMRKESYVLEDIYFNYFSHPEPVLDSTIRLGIWNQNIYKNQFQNAINNPNIKFVCNSVEGWSKELEESLKEIITSS